VSSTEGAGEARRGRLDGWPVAAAIVTLLVLLSLGMLATVGAGEDGLRLVIRTTGRVSTVLFAGAFAASAAVTLLRNSATEWLRRNRRYVGLSFAGSQAIHLAGIVALARSSVGFRADVPAETLVAGGVGYVLTLAMAATSFDGAVRWLGSSWHRLHLLGSWWICVVLLITVSPEALGGPVAAILSALLFGVVALRIAAWRRRRTRSAIGERST
jgi:DMSO/TMAO reductase YedYZ heme-binding membrane subunit